MNSENTVVPRTITQDRYNTACSEAGSDKNCLNHTFAGYNYMDHYAKLLGGLALFHERMAPIRILEIGVLEGRSLKMWADLFPHARVCGLDATYDPDCNNPRIVTYKGDQCDAGRLDVINNLDGPFDLIIDDGSHSYSDISNTFTYMFPRMNKHGIYVIEDTNVGWPLPEWPGMSTKKQYLPNDVGMFNHFIINLMMHIQMRTGPVLSIHWFHGMVAFERADTQWAPKQA